MVHTKNHFDEMIVNIDTKIFDVHFDLTKLVVELLETEYHENIDFNISIPFCIEDKYEIFNVKKMSFDSEKEVIQIFGKNENEVHYWDDFDIGTKYFLANYLYNSILSELIYNDLSNSNNQ